MTHYLRYFFCFFILTMFGSAHALAQEDSQRELELIKITDSSVSLLDAVRLTLEYNPNIKLEQETTLFEEGNLQSESGRFDTRLIVNAEGKWTQTELHPDVVKQERKRRDDLRDQIVERGREDRKMVAQDAYLEAQSNNINFTASITDFLPEGEPSLTSSDERDLERMQQNYDDRNGFFRDWMDIASDQEAVENARQDSIGLDREELLDIIEENRRNKAKEEEELRILGKTPNVKQETNVSFDLSAKKTLRSGVVLSPGLLVTEEGWQYRHKDQEESPIYNSQFRFDIQVPLGKGRGIDSTGAAERAARIKYESSLLTLQQTTSKSIYSTVLAYWELVTAQMRLDLYRKSAESQKELLELSQALVDADEMPCVELARIKAREINARAVVSDAERTLHQARLNLAQAIGLKVDDIRNAPLASEPFPEPPEAFVVETLEPADFVRSAIAQRQDHKAALKLAESARVLVRAAEVDLKPQADFGLTVSYSGLDQDANIGSGLEGAVLSDLTGPSFSGRFDLDWPLANNSARGNLTKAAATWRKSTIVANDLKRTIKSKVVCALESLKETVVQLTKNAEAAGFYKTTMNAEMEKYRAGSSTLIDIIHTEEELTDSLQDLVTTQKEYANYLAALRFETASLFTCDDKSGEVNEADLLTIPFHNGGNRN